MSTIIAPNWWISASDSGTTVSSVAMPSAACTVTSTARPAPPRIRRAPRLECVGQASANSRYAPSR